MGKKSKKGQGRSGGKGQRPGAGKGKNSNNRTTPAVAGSAASGAISVSAGAEPPLTAEGETVPSILKGETVLSPVSVTDAVDEAVRNDVDGDLKSMANMPPPDHHNPVQLKPSERTFHTLVTDETTSSSGSAFLSVSDTSLPEDALALKGTLQKGEAKIGGVTEKRPTVTFRNDVTITEKIDDVLLKETMDASRSVIETYLPEFSYAASNNDNSFLNDGSRDDVVISETNDASRSVIEVSLNDDKNDDEQESTEELAYESNIGQEKSEEKKTDDLAPAFGNTMEDRDNVDYPIDGKSSDYDKSIEKLTHSEEKKMEEESAESAAKVDPTEPTTTTTNEVVAEEEEEDTDKRSLSAKLDDILVATSDEFFGSKGDSSFRTADNNNIDEAAIVTSQSIELIVGSSNVSSLLNMSGMEASFVKYADTFVADANASVKLPTGPVDDESPMSSSNAQIEDAAAATTAAEPFVASDTVTTSAEKKEVDADADLVTVKSTKVEHSENFSKPDNHNNVVVDVGVGVVDIAEGSVDTAPTPPTNVSEVINIEPPTELMTPNPVSVTEPGLVDESVESTTIDAAAAAVKVEPPTTTESVHPIEPPTESVHPNTLSLTEPDPAEQREQQKDCSCIIL